MENTGIYHYTTLIEIDVLTGAPTGNVKPNLPSDPDYIAPITDLVACPLPTTTTTTIPNTTTTTSSSTTTTTTVFVEQITITDVLLITGSSYNIFFSSNFSLNQLYSQVSLDGVNWSTPLLLNGVTNPQNRIISFGGGNFYIRIYNLDNSSNIVYSNIFYYIASNTNIITMPSSQTISFQKTLSQVNNQGTASIQLDEALVYNGYINSQGIPYSDVKILSLPNRGTITVHGQDLAINDLVPITEIIYNGGPSSTFEFWPTGSDGSQMFSSFTTTFQYTVFDTNGNESDPVTMIINFTAL